VSTRHIAAESARLHDLTPDGSSGAAGKRFRKKLAADGFTVDEGFRLKPGYLYTVVRAISARVNQNYDGWPSDELKKSYKTFIGKPCFVNHENHDPTKARGVVVAARYVESGMDKYIEVVQEIDAQRFPKLAHEIKTGGLDSVSMGAEAGFTICSYCKNKATDLHDMCDHVKNHKGKTLTKFDRRTGKKEDILVFESCHKISFFELSYVFEPADETAVASKVVMAGLRTAGDDSDEDDNRTCEHKGNADWPSHCRGCTRAKREREAALRTASDDVAVPAQPGTPIIPQSVIDSTPVVNLSPATELTGHEAPGVPKSSGKYTKEDFANAGGKKPWEKSDANSDADDAAAIEIEAMLHRTADLTDEELAQNAKHTSIMTTLESYRKAHQAMDANGAPGGDRLDYGSGKAGVHLAPEVGHKTFEPFSHDDFPPDYERAEDIPDNAHDRLTSLNVLNVLKPEARAIAIKTMGDKMAPGGHGVISARRWRGDVENSAPHPQYLDRQPDEPNSVITGGTQAPRYQHGYANHDELLNEVQHHLGDGFTVSPTKVGSGYAAYIVKHPHVTASIERSGAVKKLARQRALFLAFGETEAPMSVNTLREEGSAPEDDDDDFERYVEPPDDLKTPDLSQAQQVDRAQEEAGASTDQMGGIPGAGEGGQPGAVPQQPQQQFMTLQIPVPAQAPQIPMQAAPPVAAPQPPAQQPPQQIAASVLDYFDRYYGRRVANWYDAIEARREMTPAEAADYRRQAERLSTLENGREHSTTNRNPTKGTAKMARSNIASRNKVATAGRRQHFAEGPLVDGGDRSRNDQGEQEEAFISQTPPLVPGDYPTGDTPISNTEHNLVARVQQGRDQLLRDARQLAALRQRRAFDEAGGPTADVVDPTVNSGPEAEALTGDGFVSADPNDGVVPTNPKDASLRAFQAFDGWLSAKTGKSSRRHTEANIKKAAAAFSREAGISPQALFPALGIVLREARKNDKKANKGAAMKKRANESLDVAAPDGRIDVEAPVADTTDAKAQASQFDLHDFGNNAGDNVAKPDLSTDQNWAPGEASKKASIKTAGGLLAMRCAEAMIAAGLEPNDRERKYALAAEFENMNRSLIQDRVALLERFASVREADLRRVASGSSRGAARSPIPAGLGGGTRTAATGMRTAAHDPSNDSSLFI